MHYDRDHIVNKTSWKEDAPDGYKEAVESVPYPSLV